MWGILSKHNLSSSLSDVVIRSVFTLEWYPFVGFRSRSSTVLALPRTLTAEATKTPSLKTLPKNSIFRWQRPDRRAGHVKTTASDSLVSRCELRLLHAMSAAHFSKSSERCEWANSEVTLCLFLALTNMDPGIPTKQPHLHVLHCCRIPCLSSLL